MQWFMTVYVIQTIMHPLHGFLTPTLYEWFIQEHNYEDRGFLQIVAISAPIFIFALYIAIILWLALSSGEC